MPDSIQNDDIGNKNQFTSDTSDESAQSIFEKKFETTMDGFSSECDKEQVSTFISIVKHPSKNTPMVYYRGHIYDAAVLLASVLRMIKSQIQNDLA